MSRRPPKLSVVVSLAGLFLYMYGCALRPEVDVTLAESPLGAVYLERIPDRTFQAAHPIKISEDTMARVLRGLLVKENQGLLNQFISGAAAPQRAFTDEEVQFLAPLLSNGLTRAAADQQIGFRVIQRGPTAYSQTVGASVGSSEPPLRLSPPETTSGGLYAYGRSLYVTLREYRRRPEGPDTINMPNRRIPDSTGLANRTVLFVPESARRPASYRGKDDSGVTVAIDYELLAALPLASTVPASSSGARPIEPVPTPSIQGSAESGADPQLRSLQDQMHQKNVELEELRKELRDIRQQLNDPSTTRSPAQR